MANFDVFNGDADGICSLVQLRLAQPRESTLVTGTKREINLLKQVMPSAADSITVLDISMQKNHADLRRVLDAGAKVFYADHHNPGEIIEHTALETHVDTSASTCTALIVDKYLNSEFHLWAITAAFGDNLTEVAFNLAVKEGLNNKKSSELQKLGTYLNYNGYGAIVDDLFYHPADLYQECVKFESPFDFIKRNRTVFDTLQNGYQSDLATAQQTEPFHFTNSVAAFMLPNEPWARRVSGVFGNQLSNQNPERAHIILTQKTEGIYLVSIRSPLNHPFGADEVAGRFDTGGGRQGAAGINALPKSKVGELINLMEQRYKI